jgi:cell division protein FtsB
MEPQPPTPDSVDWLTRLGAPYVATALAGMLSALIGLLAWVAGKVLDRVAELERLVHGKAASAGVEEALAALAAADTRLSRELADLRVHVEHSTITRDDVERRLASILADLRMVETRLYDVVRGRGS